MQWDDSPNAGFTTALSQNIYLPIIDDDTYGCRQVNVKSQQANSASLWHAIRHMIEVRKEHLAFGRGEFQWIDCDNDAIAAYTRTYQNQVICVVNNLSAEKKIVSLPLQEPARQLTDLLTGIEYYNKNHKVSLELNPRQFLWLA
jgi:maltose alpha-D-glucosyltransferase/alpha-amylase